MKRMRILGIETSCDETAVALLDVEGDSVKIAQNLVSSQIPVHQRYGGVVPEVAARLHVPEMISLLSQALGEDWSGAFDAIAVTAGPGLPTALLVGLESAKLLAVLSGKPLIGVNHLEGHLASAWLNTENRAKWEYPLLALSVSGGHTELILVKEEGVYEVVGESRDDAAGEAFDKTAKLLGLSYPGGPQIARLAQQGNPTRYLLPRPMLNEPSCDMSFSGLKNAVRLLWKELQETMPQEAMDQVRADVAAGIQAAIVDVLVEKTLRAVKKYPVQAVVLVGGVSANAELRARMEAALAQRAPGVAFLPSDKQYVTDNAAMIAAAGSWRLGRGETSNPLTLELDPEWYL
jgi:N6-L-threonylcarbamoyladenine synthase